ncbi:unnamed protein product [Leptosia nina]|uniref:Uncharacterized protein n=1 Tax=Leptosia nina TaxID=320188 RepID=A0AAV1JLI1_9NEOP
MSLLPHPSAAAAGFATSLNLIPSFPHPCTSAPTPRDLHSLATPHPTIPPPPIPCSPRPAQSISIAPLSHSGKLSSRCGGGYLSVLSFGSKSRGMYVEVICGSREAGGTPRRALRSGRGEAPPRHELPEAWRPIA